MGPGTENSQPVLGLNSHSPLDLAYLMTLVIMASCALLYDCLPEVT